MFCFHMTEGGVCGSKIVGKLWPSAFEGGLKFEKRMEWTKVSVAHVVGWHSNVFPNFHREFSHILTFGRCVRCHSYAHHWKAVIVSFLTVFGFCKTDARCKSYDENFKNRWKVSANDQKRWFDFRQLQPSEVDCLRSVSCFLLVQLCEPSCMNSGTNGPHLTLCLPVVLSRRLTTSPFFCTYPLFLAVYSMLRVHRSPSLYWTRNELF